jgi:hypothetical protein
MWKDTDHGVVVNGVGAYEGCHGARGIVNIYLFTSQLWELSGQRVEAATALHFADNLSIKFLRLAPQGHRPFIITSLYQLGQLLTSPLEYATTGS